MESYLLYNLLFKLLNGVSGYPKHLISVDNVEWCLFKMRKCMGESFFFPPKAKHYLSTYLILVDFCSYSEGIDTSQGPILSQCSNLLRHVPQNGQSTVETIILSNKGCCEM